MSKIKTIDRNTVRVMRTVMETMLQDFEAEFGVKVTLGSARFTERNVTFKTDVGIVDDGGVVHSAMAEDFIRYAQRHGIPVENLGKTFVSNGEIVKLIGYKPRATRFPFVGERTDGKRFKYTAATVALGFARGEG